jgi:hypothetical protein
MTEKKDTGKPAFMIASVNVVEPNRMGPYMEAAGHGLYHRFKRHCQQFHIEIIRSQAGPTHLSRQKLVYLGNLLV